MELDIVSLQLFIRFIRNFKCCEYNNECIKIEKAMVKITQQETI